MNLNDSIPIYLRVMLSASDKRKVMVSAYDEHRELIAFPAWVETNAVIKLFKQHFGIKLENTGLYKVAPEQPADITLAVQYLAGVMALQQIPAEEVRP